MTRQKYYWLWLLLLSSAAQGQLIQPIPEMVVSQQEPFTGTSFFLPDSNKIMTLHKGKVHFYSLKGEQLPGSVNIKEKNRDFIYPRVSRSGNIIAWYTAPENFMEDARITLYNRDSAASLGRYKIPGTSSLENIRLEGDSIFHYFVQFSDFRISYLWNTVNGKIRSFNMTEDTLHSGIYDMAYKNDRTYVALRYADTLALYIANNNDTRQQWRTVQLLPSVNNKLDVRFTDGYPCLLVNDTAFRRLSIFKPSDTSYREIFSTSGYYNIIAAAADDEHCFVLCSSPAAGSENLYLIDVSANKKTEIPVSSKASGSYLFYLFPDKNIITASHQVNGTVMAWDIRTGKKSWEFIPPLLNEGIQPAMHDSTGGKLFKVLIKQGSGDVQGWQFNQVANQLYLFKNRSKLVTVDADAKCAVKWDYFNKDNYRVTNTSLFPGYRYIMYSEERWEKDFTATRKSLTDEIERNEDVNKEEYLYPYSCKIFDRNSGTDVFTLLSSSETEVKILNDSLICFRDQRDNNSSDSVIIHNLHSGKSYKLRPYNESVYRYNAMMLQNNIYFFCSTIDDKLVLTTAAKKELFSRSFPGNNNAIDLIRIIPRSPYFYIEAQPGAAAQLYRIENDAVVPYKKLPPGIDVLATKHTASGCYMLYKKIIQRKKAQVVHYRFININTGQDKLVDSVSVENDRTFASYEIYPDENYYLENENNVITWKDLNSGMEFKDFGRDEPTLVSLVYSSDGRYLAAANPSGKVMLWDLGTGKENKTLKVASEGYITKLAFSGDGKWLAASSGDIWETATGKNVVSVTDGSIWEVNSIDFSSDGKRIISGGACIISWDAADGSKLQYQQEPGKKDMDTSGTCWNRNGCVDPKFRFMVHSVAFHPNGRDFVAGNVSGLVQKWNTEDTELHASKFLAQQPGQVDKIYDIKYSRDGNAVITVQQKTLYKLDGNSLQVMDSVLLPDGETISAIDMSYDEKIFGCIAVRNNQRIVQLRNTSNLQVVKEFHAEGASFNQLSFSPNKTQAATASEDGFCTIWDVNTGKPVMYLNSIGDFGNVMVTPDNFYMASKSALDGVSFSKDDNFYSFDQFDLYLNRPDIVLSRLGYASPELINFYYSAYLKRLKKATGSTSDSTVNNYVPLLKLSNRKSITAVQVKEQCLLRFSITDPADTKGILKILINGNLVKEYSFPATAGNNFEYADSVLLSQGVNNIEAVYVNNVSVESRKEKISISHSPVKRVAEKIWFIGVGVSTYKTPEMNLKYPAKDVRDLAAVLKKKYPGLIIDTLINAKATRENIVALKEKLMKTNVNDKVIVSFNGHGLLSDSLDWYFATYDVDVKKPEQAGLSYASMENILQGIPARQKLLLLDACHSGEVDKEKDITFANKETGMQQNVVATTARGNIVIGKSKTGLQTSFEMMQELFANLGNGNGTTVLSAAGGREYALESDEWKNGVFTYSIIRALKDPATDENNNKKISVKELKKVVFDSVKTLTGGRQKPTSRVEASDDWNIW